MVQILLSCKCSLNSVPTCRNNSVFPFCHFSTLDVRVLLSKNKLSVGATGKNDNPPFVQANHRHKRQVKTANRVNVPGWCRAWSRSLQLSAQSPPPRGHRQVHCLDPFVRLDFPQELLQAALPGPQCAGSPFPTAPSPAGPPGANAPSPAPGEQSSPGSAEPEGSQGEQERKGL